MWGAEKAGCHSEPDAVPTQVSGYDRVNAGLVTALLLSGGLVLLLLSLWMNVTEKTNYHRVIVPTSTTGHERIPAEALEIDLPDPATTEFALGTQASLADSLRAVIEAVSTIEARPETGERQSLEPGLGLRSGFPHSIPGLPLFGTGGPEWLVELEAPHRNGYVALLEALGMEIAALEKAGDQVDRVVLADGTATLIASNRREMRDLQMTFLAHQNPRLQAWDRELLRSAGRKSLESCIVGQLYPPAVIAELGGLERVFAEANGWTPEEIRRTVFRVVKAGGKFRFEVESQQRRR
jgi:hypothetical protein